MASYEIQFGHLQRPTHFNTSWDVARFEVRGFVGIEVRGFVGIGAKVFSWDIMLNVVTSRLLE